MKHTIIAILLLITTFSSEAQDTEMFRRLTEEAKNYKPDTSAAPDDKITRKIIELRSLKGGFNINEAMDFKFQEEMQKSGADEKWAKLSESFNHGKGKQWLDNAVIRIYREEFSYKELKQLVKFYKTPAGRKIAKDFPIIMVKSLVASAMIQQALE